MTGLIRGHIIIDISPDMWPEMRSHFERLSRKRTVVAASYRGRPLFQIVIGSDVQSQRRGP